MKQRTTVFVSLLLLSLIPFAGCERPTQADADNNEQAPTADFKADILAAAAGYLKFPMATTDAGVAPAACAAAPSPPAAQLSKSDDDATHGQKIYYLFAKDAADYNVGQGEATVGQVIVKESWVAEQAAAPKPGWQQHASGHQVSPIAWQDEKAFVAKEKGPLFLMMKFAADTPGTDNGWVYATTSADGTKVNEIGKLQNCMDCHKDAPRDRLFGLR